MPLDAVGSNGQCTVYIAVACMEPSSGLPLPVKVSSRKWCAVFPQYVIYALSSVSSLQCDTCKCRGFSVQVAFM